MVNPLHIGGRIACFRKQAGMTQSALSEQLGVTHQSVSKWERGMSLPELHMLVALAKLFGVTVDDLLREAEPGETDCPEAGFGGESEEEQPPPSSKKDVDMEQVWSIVLHSVRSKISKPSYDTWFRHTAAVIEDGMVVIIVPNQIQTEWLYSRYSAMILNELAQFPGMEEVKIGFRPRTEGDAPKLTPHKGRAKLL